MVKFILPSCPESSGFCDEISQISQSPGAYTQSTKNSLQWPASLCYILSSAFKLAHSTTRKAKPWPHKVALVSVTLCAGISLFHPKYSHVFLLLLPLPGAGPNLLAQPQPLPLTSCSYLLPMLLPLGMVTNYSSSALQPLPPRLTVAYTCGHLVTAYNFSPGLSSCLLTGFALCLLMLLQS